MEKNKNLILLILTTFLLNGVCWAEKESLITTKSGPVESPVAAAEALPAIQEENAQDQLTKITKAEVINFTDTTNYTLGSDDVIQIDVQRHPEFSGIFPVNQEGKIQCKFVGDIEVTGLNKKELEQKIKTTISTYIINPEVSVTILDYKSKVIYVLGEVGSPGKYFMRAESIPIREAVILAGLPTFSAAMRRCRLISPDKAGKAKTKDVDLYSLLYEGNLTKNLDMHAGDVLYVPATVLAKIIRVINPVTSAVGVASSGPAEARKGVSATEALTR